MTNNIVKYNYPKPAALDMNPLLIPIPILPYNHCFLKRGEVIKKGDYIPVKDKWEEVSEILIDTVVERYTNVIRFSIQLRKAA